MPLVNITLVEGRPPSERARILTSVHRALLDADQRESSIRIWITEVPPADFLVAGKPAEFR